MGRFIYGYIVLIDKFLKGCGMTITVDDAGSGDLLFGVVVGVYRNEGGYFRYDVVDVRFFQPPLFKRKEYLQESCKLVLALLDRIGVRESEEILVCTSYLFDQACEELCHTYGKERIKRVKVVGEPQRCVETAYLDEVRNLGYEPMERREEERGKSFFHMLGWLKAHPERVKYAKTGWPRLSRYHLFKQVAGRHSKG